MEVSYTIASFRSGLDSDEEKLISMGKGLMGNGLAKISDKEVWHRGIWMDIWKCTQGMRIFISHLNAHQRASTMGDNQGDKIIWPVNVNQVLSVPT